MQYEGILGSILLELERYRRALAAVFRHMASGNPPPVASVELAAPLLPSFGHVLGALPPPATSAEVLQTIASGTDVDTSTPVGQLLGDQPLISLEVAALLQSVRPALSARFRDAVFNDADIVDVYDRLVRAAGSLLVSSPQVPPDLPSGAGAGNATPSLSPPSPRPRQSSSNRALPSPTPSQVPTPDSAPKDGKRRAASSKASKTNLKMTRERLARYQAVARAREQQRASEIRRLRKADRLPSAPAWPRGPPHRLDLPSSVLEIRQMAWGLSLLTTEQVVPDPRSYSTVVEGLESYQVPLKEIAQVYASKPWEVIASPPTPQFPHDDRFPDLARFVKNTQDFYRKNALVLWERTHAFSPAADGRALFGSTWMTTSEYLKKRRDRNSKLTQPLLKHYTLLSALTQYPGLGGDFLLDPFHYWAPVYGALLVAPKLHQSLADAATAADLATPGRLYFRGPGGDRAFVEAIGLSQDRVAEIKRKFAALSPVADVQLQPLPTGSPSLPTFGHGSRTDDRSGESNAGNATEVISDAPGGGDSEDEEEHEDSDDEPRPPSKRSRTIVQDEPSGTPDVVDLSISSARPASSPAPPPPSPDTAGAAASTSTGWNRGWHE